ncbi:RING finger protein narya-like [Musca vetustissima]|uniref:RING finger protein narya-like n=1 Tax=Musca vetustissima TaxID=27455 RepID=UPI002AB68D97|nr:RING finger protein narya-like [Musca vetustissima]
MPPSMSEYFEDPIKAYRRYQKIVKFHFDQERSIGIHLYRSNEAAIRKLTAELQGFNELKRKLIQTKEKERERIRKLKEYVAYHERRQEQPKYMKPPVAVHPKYRYAASKAHSNISDTSTDISVDCTPKLTQTIRAHYAPPRTPTLSNDNSSESEKLSSQTSSRRLRVPPPLLPCSPYKKRAKSPKRKYY